ncbi:MAG: hypothetical protein LC725_05445 [Lentisphaerae bacterium]|nr:hypothetical protein [Lentisphaerota bacterium]
MLAAGVIAGLLAGYAWQRRSRPEMLVFFWLMLAVGLWSITYGLEIGSTDFKLMKVLLAISYPGIAAVPVLWLLFAMIYCRHGDRLSPGKISLLFIIPVVTIAAVATNDFHNLFYLKVTQHASGAYRYQALQNGPLWWLNLGYSHLVVITGMLIFARRFMHAANQERRRILVFLSGAMLPFAVNIAYVAGFKPHGFIDTTPMAFVGMGVILAFAVFRINVFDVTQPALDVLFEHMPDAIFILDTQKQIVRTNLPARLLLAERGLSTDSRHGMVLTGDNIFLPVLPGETDCNIDKRFYHSIVSVVATTAGEAIGTLIVLRDISARKQAELEKELTIKQLRQALAEIKSLQGIIPICASCKKIRNDKGYWEQVEAYVSKHTDAVFTHGICPECMKSIYGSDVC